MLCAAALVLAVVARALRLPPAITFVCGGMVLAVLPWVPNVRLDPDLVMTLFLPPLLQASAFFTVWRDFKANLRPILSLAVGAVGFTTLAVGVAAHWVAPSLPWAACFTLGAIVSPPDAVAASAVLARLRLPRRLVTVLEGESLVNDASGLVLYRFAMAAALTGTFSASHAAASFVAVSVGGIAVGYALGRLLVLLLRKLADTQMEVTTSFLASWASYIAAEQLGVSGVLSTVTCGLVLNWYQHGVLSSRTRLEAKASWGLVTFLLEAMVFVLIGLSVHEALQRVTAGTVMELAALSGVVTVAVILARLVWIIPAAYLPYVLMPKLKLKSEMPPPAATLVIAWAGMRGVVSLAAALALPEEFPGRDAILIATFAVILASLLVQGTTLAPLVRWLGLIRLAAATVQDDEKAEADARANVSAASLRLIESRSADPLDGAMAADLLPEYRDARAMATMPPKGAAARAARSARLSLRLEALAEGRNALLRLHRDGRLHDHLLSKLETELDLDELRIRGRLDGGSHGH